MVQFNDFPANHHHFDYEIPQMAMQGEHIRYTGIHTVPSKIYIFYVLFKVKDDKNLNMIISFA